MSSYRAYTLEHKAFSQLANSLRAVSINVEAVSPREEAPLGIQQMWSCSDSRGQLFNLLATELNEKNLGGRPIGTVYIEVWPLEKRAPKRIRKEVLAALGKLDNALANLHATKCN